MELSITPRLLQSIHPFPARMAPEIALEQLRSLDQGSLVLDPMVGSGTTLKAASRYGLPGIGFDVDPLAVLMSRVWTTPTETQSLAGLATELVEEAESMDAASACLPWLDEKTSDFINYWFGKEQQADLSRLAILLCGLEGPEADVLRLALSRIIVTKDRGASLARDVSHSRPHRVRDRNDFPVFGEYLRSVRYLVQKLEDDPPRGNVQIRLGDARQLSEVADASVDAIITSPPYLNAIDYLRGHRLALVWLGHRIGDLRYTRSSSIGAERAPDDEEGTDTSRELVQVMVQSDLLPVQLRPILHRYALDLYRTMLELARVIRVGGSAVFVIGNSCVRGVYVNNAALVSETAHHAGFTILARSERELPVSRRYLPPPESLNESDLGRRMRREAVIYCRR